MPTFDIDRLYADLRPDLDRLEADRQDATEKVRKLNVYLFGGGMVLAVVAWFSINGWAALIAALLTVVAYGYAQNKVLAPVGSGYKEKVLPEVITRLGPGFSYVQGGEVPVARFEQSGLFGDFNRAALDDHIGLRRDDQRWDLYDVHLRRSVRHPRSDDDTERSVYTLFEGLVFTARVPRPFDAKCWVITRDLDPITTDDAVVKHREAVETGDEAFDGRYQVYMDEPGSVHAVLTPALRERMLSLRAHLALEDHVINYALVGDELTISVQLPQAFEKKVDETINDPDQFHSNVAFLVNCTRMLEHLGLER